VEKEVYVFLFMVGSATIATHTHTAWKRVDGGVKKKILAVLDAGMEFTHRHTHTLLEKTKNFPMEACGW
jgi:hypothetical protein